MEMQDARWILDGACRKRTCSSVGSLAMLPVCPRSVLQIGSETVQTSTSAQPSSYIFIFSEGRQHKPEIWLRPSAGLGSHK